MTGYNFIQPLLQKKWSALMLFVLGALSSLILLATPDFKSKVTYKSYDDGSVAFVRDAFIRTSACDGLKYRLSSDAFSDNGYILTLVVVGHAEVETRRCIDNMSKLFQENQAIYFEETTSLLEEENIVLEGEQAVLKKEIDELASNDIINAAYLIGQYSHLQNLIANNTKVMQRLQPSTIFAPASTTVVKKRNKLRYALGGGLAGLLLFAFLFAVFDARNEDGHRQV
jgi:hypothetical protein